MSGLQAREATLDDVARSAGVSRATASRVVTGTGSVSPAARRQVTAAAERLGYAPDPVARALATRGGFRLVVAVSGGTADVLHDPYVERVVGAAAAAAAPHRIGVSLLWVPLSVPAQVAALAQDRSVRAVILINTTGQVLDAVPGHLRGRVVSIGIGSRVVPAVDVDVAQAAEEVVSHLLASGRRRIAMVTGPRWLPCTHPAVLAYRRILRQAGLPVRLASGDFSAHRGRAAVAEVLRRWPDTDALYASNDATALGVLAGLRERGVDVPGDIAVAGFDDIPFASLSAPALTTASHPVARIATTATEAVLHGTALPPRTLYPSELVRRESA